MTPGRDGLKRSKEQSDRRKADCYPNAFCKNRFGGNSLLRRGMAGHGWISDFGEAVSRLFGAGRRPWSAVA